MAITCNFCKGILDSPVVLPCGESVCEKDVNKKDNCFNCFGCGFAHPIPEGGFCLNKAFDLIIRTKIAELNIGAQYQNAYLSFKSIESMLKELKLLKADPDYFINESITTLKRKVDIKREELKLKIDDEANIIIDDLNKFELDCKNNHRSSELFLNKSIELENKIKRIEDELNAWSSEMKILQIDEEKWRKVNEINELIIKDLESEIKLFQDNLLLNKHKEFIVKQFEFEDINIKPKNKLDSKILDSKLKSDLLELCDFPVAQEWKLLYRASEDGFAGANFHTKCSGKGNTLTIIKSANGNIFGGYCNAKWNKNEKFIKDKNAFIFSLVNGENARVKIEIDTESENNAIQCHQGIGPIFGGIHINGGDRDIYISDNSNTNNISYSDLGRCYKHKNYVYGSQKARSFLAGSQHFQVSNIEVYQKLGNF